MKIMAELKKIYIKQQDQSDCGVACLHMILAYYGGNESFERIRELSGTQKTGTTLLGLMQAGKELHLDVQAFEALPEQLKEVEEPCILHVTKKGGLNHYIVFFGYHENRFVFADPADGWLRLTETELIALWQSKALLVLKKTNLFVQSKEKKKNTYSWVKEQLKIDSNRFILIFILGLITAILSLTISLFTQQLIDRILPEKQYTIFIVGFLLTALLLLFQNGLSFIRTRFLVEQSRNFNTRVVGWFLEKLVKLPQLFFDTRTTGDFVSRLQDTSKLQRVISYIIGDLGISFLVFVTSLSAILVYSWQIGLILLFWIPFFGLIVLLFKNELLQLQRKVLTSYAQSETQFIDVIQGMDVIKSTFTQSLFTKISLSSYSNYQQDRFQLGIKSATFTLISGILVLLGTLSIIGIGGFYVLEYGLQIGVFIATIQLSGQTLQSTQTLFISIIQLQEAKVVYDRMIEFTSLEIEAEKNTVEIEEGFIPECIQIKDLSHRFNGRKQTFSQINFSLKKGKIVALMGDSGSGKSTLVRVLDQLYPFENGTITIKPQKFDFTKLSEQSCRKLVSVVHQQDRLFSGTVVQNLVMSDDPKVIEQKLIYCSQLGFDAQFARFSQGYLTQVGKDGIQLSGGQKQLVSFARAILANRPVLLLDEPTTAMDKSMRDFVFRLLHQLKKDKLILLVTHLEQVANQAEEVVLMP